ARPLRGEHAAFDQRRDDAAGMARRDGEYAGDVPTWQLAAIEECFEYIAGLRRHRVEMRFLFGPEQDARAQTIGLHQLLHEAHLVQAGLTKKSRERSQGFLTQVAAPVEIVAARQVAFGKVP